ncbi:hypothetical protein [Staphylococcus aureus]|uniref:hypothetical protein n=1 Tax=Staphylococcus aureus TaxID=1280 RepID=UPI00388F9980
MRHDIYEGVLFYIMKVLNQIMPSLVDNIIVIQERLKYEAGKENELERLKKTTK